MKIFNLILWDMRFQAKYGFYLLYAFLTVLYTAVLVSIPQSIKPALSAILIFSDPAAMGLFFMGAIILMEKSQNVTSSFSVSPFSALEYVVSKTLSLSITGTFVAVLIAFFSGSRNIPGIIFGTLPTGILFTLSGIIIGVKISSLNQFIIATTPIEIIAFVPAVLHLLKITPDIFKIYPPCFCIDLISEKGFNLPGFFMTAVFIMLLLAVSCSCVRKMFCVQGKTKI